MLIIFIENFHGEVPSMGNSVPRIMLAGAGSGCGKTTMTCAVLQALTDRGVDTIAFKCGPDYIDPMFHRRITSSGGNLDPFFFPPDTMNYLLDKYGGSHAISVIEGVMGYYDGLGLSDEASTSTVARDNAFCFYYEESLDLLREMGAELVDFSPLKDKSIPSGIHGLYLGGGYPELYAGELSRNASMLASVREALASGLPTIAECGGFMYLTEAIGGEPMASVLPGTCRDTGKLTRFGYVNLAAKEDNLLCRAGESIPAHEFHHWDCTEPGEKFTAAKPSGRRWACAQATGRLYAGFPHFHFLANPSFAENFYETCLEVKRGHA